MNKRVRFFIVLIISIFAVTKGFSQFSKDFKYSMDSLLYTTSEKYNLKDVVIGITDIDGNVLSSNYGDYNTNDRFLIGSLSKSFTALAILKLQEQNKLNINNKVIEYLPWFYFKDTSLSNQITIRNLLNHTSGIPRKYGMYKPKANDNIITYYKYLLQKIDAKGIGNNYEYCNLNYQILGLIIEQITNESYAFYVKNNICDPFQMHHTYFTESYAKPQLVNSYQYLLYKPILRHQPSYIDHLVPSGFIASSANDMLKYFQNIMISLNSTNDTLISKNSLGEIFYSRKDINSFYGMGWESRYKKDKKVYLHDGLTPSFASSMCILPESNIAFIILSNSNYSPATIELRNNIIRLLNKQKSFNYSSRGFYMRNSLPIFVIWILITFIILFIKWLKFGFPINYTLNYKSNIILLIGIAFGLLWIIYIPYRFNTPLKAIIEYEPNSGYCFLLLTQFIIANSIIRYFIKNHKNKLKKN